MNLNKRKALEKEIKAQIHKCRENGLILTHADSHHQHNEWNIEQSVERVLLDENIKSIHLARNCGLGINFKKRLYKTFYNYILHANGFKTVDYFGSFKDFLYYFSKKNNISCFAIEAMCHPMLVGDTVMDTNGPLKSEVSKLKEFI